MMDADTKKKVIARLKRAEGQVAALRRMVEEDTYCVDILVQISAVQGALGKAGQIILGSHVRTCVSHAFNRGDEDEKVAKVEELMDVFGRYAGIGGR